MFKGFFREMATLNFKIQRHVILRTCIAAHFYKPVNLLHECYSNKLPEHESMIPTKETNTPIYEHTVRIY